MAKHPAKNQTASNRTTDTANKNGALQKTEQRTVNTTNSVNRSTANRTSGSKSCK